MTSHLLFFHNSTEQNCWMSPVGFFPRYPSYDHNSSNDVTKEPCGMHVNQTNMLTSILSVSHCSSIYPQKEALSKLDLMLFWFSRLDLVTKLASPLCRRLLCAAFCCLVSCLRTFWRTTSCSNHKQVTTHAHTDCLSRATLHTLVAASYFCKLGLLLMWG